MTVKVTRCKKYEEVKMNITHPCIAQIKIDGVFAYVKDGIVYSRANKPIPNKHVQKLFSHLEGFCAELLLSPKATDRCFNETTSAVMTIKGEPDVYFHVYDDWRRTSGYIEWHKTLWGELDPNGRRCLDSDKVILHPYGLCPNEALLGLTYMEAIEKGLEGIIIRNPDAPYRHGTATKKNWELVKWKPKDDAEFEVVGFEELMHNTNGEVGKRSSHKEGLVPANTLGALILKYGDTTFKVGTGFDVSLRQHIWDNRDTFKGQFAKVEYEGIAKNVPRFPSFKGFRAQEDML